MYTSHITFVLLFVVELSFGSKVYDSKQKIFLDKSDDGIFNMIIMGDWGGLPIPPYYSPFEKATANQIMKVATSGGSNSVLALGDNFYETGVVDEFDSRFEETYEKVFNEPSFRSLPWYVLAGNHDHYGNVSGQIEYTKHSHRWNFPRLWYGISIQRPEFNISIVMIDTVTLCGNTAHDAHGDQPDGVVDDENAADQLQFIEENLKNNNDPYVIVAGHFPVWSVAEHGPTQCLIDKLKPLLEKYQVSAYFSGHDHNLQHIKESNSSVEYFVSGAVDVVEPSMKHEDSIPKDSLRYYWANILGLGGFATMSVDKDHMTIEFMSAVGNKLYEYQISPRK